MTTDERDAAERLQYAAFMVYLRADEQHIDKLRAALAEFDEARAGAGAEIIDLVEALKRRV